MTRSDMPRRVYLRHNAYYFVTLAGKWIRLSSVKDGLPAMYRALATLTDTEAVSDRLPAVLARWADSKRHEWAPKTESNMDRVVKLIADRFADFDPIDVTTPVCAEYLKPLPARTFNVHRSVMRQVLAFAAIEGLREGFNPIENIPQKKTPGRSRIVSDAEIKALRAAALIHEGKDGEPDKDVRNGKALVQMIDLALLTGMRIGDLIRLRWQDVGAEGVTYYEGKKRKTPRLVEWSLALRAAIAACERGDRIGHVLQKEAGGGYRYSGIRSAWVRACERAGIEDLNIHDFRGRAGVDAMGDDEDIRKTQRLLGHSTEAMSRHYVEGKYAKKTKPAR